MSERLYLLDGPGYLYRAYHALPFLSTSKGQPCHAVYGMSTMVWKLLREEQPEFFAVAWDPPGPTFREARYEGYKAERPAMPADLRSQIALVRALFEALRAPVLEVSGFEADDVLGTLVERARGTDLEVVLVTSDKDMLQLVRPGVRVLSTLGRTGERSVYDEAAVAAKWGVRPDQIADLLALMGDSIDNIPGVPGVGEKTAVKLIAQFGSVERLYENLHLVAGKLRETLASHRQQALLARELATVSTRVPLAAELETLRRQEPDWPRLRALWGELEFHTLLRQLPSDAAPAAVAEESLPALEGPEALADYLARVPAGDPLAVDWVGEPSPPDPALAALGLFHPAAGPARLALAGAVPALGERALVGHDVKPLLEWWLARGAPAPAMDDTAVAAYLLNPTRSNYRLEEVSAELLGEGPGLLPPGSRAATIWRMWEMMPRALGEVGLAALYTDLERPLVPVLATMERHGIRVEPARLGEFSRELEVHLDRITREIYELAGGEFNIGSPKQLGQVLFEKLKLPPVKRTKTGYSTDADVLEHLALGHALPAKIIEHRTLTKLKSTYADALPELINARTGRIHTTFNQLVAATGRLSCLPAGTLVNTQRGLVGIETVRAGDTIRTCEGPRRVLAWEPTGPKPVVAIRLSTGGRLRCSPDHKLRSKGMWKDASCLAVGDPVYMTFHEGLFGEDVALEVGTTAAYATRKSPRLPDEWSVELAELVGYTMADGHIARSNYNDKPAKLILAFNWDEDELVEHFSRIIVGLFGKTPTRRLTRSCPVLEISGVDICGLLEQIGAGGKSGSIRVPPSLRRAPRAIVAGFLRGYFEGDGSATTLSVRSVSRSMLEDVHHLLALFGIPSRLTDGPADLRGYAPRHTLRVLGDRSKRMFLDRIGFVSARKLEELTAWVARRSPKSAAELLTLREPEDVLCVKADLYDAWRDASGVVAQRTYVFAHKYAAGKTTVTLRRAEEISLTLLSGGKPTPAYLDELITGQYFEVRVGAIDDEPAVPMYDIAVEGEHYVANGIVVHNSASPNLQNIPVRTELGRRIRAAFIPEPGWRFLAADYSQIELRLLAHMSGEEGLIEAFRTGEDIHRRTASEVFGAALDAVTPEQRDIAKTTNFSVIYGVSAFGLSRGLSITQKEAQGFLTRFFARHPKVKAYLDRAVVEGRERGYVSTLLGRRRYLPELESGNPNLRSFGERVATNTPIQGTAADLIKIAMLRMARGLEARGLRSRMLLQVHDELLFEGPPEEMAALEALAVEVMEGAMALSVPLRVDVKTGTDWASV